MANVNAPSGLKPVSTLSGAPWNGKTRMVYVSSSYAVALFVGDPVDIDTTASEKDPKMLCETVIKGSVAGPNLGVIVGIDQVLGQTTPNLNLNYLPASTGGYIYITMDQGDIIYEVQGDPYAALTAGTAIGWNANMIFTLAGSTVTGLSGVQMDTGTTTAPAATNTLGMKIIGACARPDNDPTLKNAKWLVCFNNCRLGNLIAGIGS